MAEKTDNFLTSLNKYAGLFAMFSFVAAALFWVFSSGAILSDLKAEQAQVIKTTSEIKNTLGVLNRDHLEFQKRTEFQNQLLLEQTKILDRLAFTLDNLDKKLEKM
jgi:hypothetical protein